jgi:molecular chaperone DnaJ
VVDKDPYKVLGVERGASDDEIRRAFRDIASKLHPDRNPGDKEAEEAFKVANSAFQTLSDPVKRAKWDRMNVPFVPLDGGFGGVSSESFNRTMQDLFKNHATRAKERSQDSDPTQAPVMGEDLHAVLNISLKEAATGCVKQVSVISLKSKIKCDGCDGSGVKPTGRKFPCGSCSGRGKKVSFSSGGGPTLNPCPSCRGTGWSSPDKCEKCGGSGKVSFKRTVNVTVPVGISDGQVLRLAGLGTPGVMSKPGDMFVTVRVAPDDNYRRSGHDIHAVRVLTLSEALLGGEVEVPTLDGGSVMVPIPSGVRPGKDIRVEKAGIRSPVDPKSTGDLVVSFQVMIPEKMSSRAKKLAEELAEELSKKGQEG